MSLSLIVFFSISAILIGLIPRQPLRFWLIFLVSIATIIVLQPASSLRHVDFWLAIVVIALTVVTWIATVPEGYQFSKTDALAATLIVFVVGVFAITRYLGISEFLLASRPPSMPTVLTALLVFACLSFLIGALNRRNISPLDGITLTIVALLILTKYDPAAELVSRELRLITGQSQDLASGIDFRWFGFSYIAFRLIQTARDRGTGTLPTMDLREYISFVLFFPALPAGPIDRAERFVHDLRSSTVLSPARAADGLGRLIIGVFKKFVIANLLAMIALNATNALQIRSPIWLWIVLYAYAFMIYMDFAGYTDVAIGMGSLLGVRLPENFNRPYIKPNLQQFWNSWHITLAQWFRSYVFNPMTRAFRTGTVITSAWLIIFIGQMITMVLIGLWHDITWNYAIWGAWHGVGLFVHNRWVNFSRTHPDFVLSKLGDWKLIHFANIVLTFNYVALGWVWFALPTPQLSVQVFAKLFGL